jgi:branched-chain amino acid aminotransferase
LGDQKTKYAFFNSNIVRIEDANISIKSCVIHYGTGIFEGIRSYWNDEEKKSYIFRVDEHYERMKKNAKIIAMEIPYTSEELKNYTIELIKKEDFKEDIYIRPLAYYASENILEKLNSKEYGFFIYCFPMQAILNLDEGLKVCVSSWTRVNDNMIAPRGKITGSYVNISLVNYEAKQSGYDDGIILTADGHVSEGGGQNVVIIRGNKFIAPPVSDDILEGITLDSLIRIIEENDLGLEVERRSIDRTELYICDEALYCGTGAQVTPIISIDNRNVGDGKVGKYTRSLQDIFFDVVRGRNNKYKHWCTSVE